MGAAVRRRVQLSQHTNSPAPLQAEQKSSLSEGGEPWQGVNGGDKVELGGENGNFGVQMGAVKSMCDENGNAWWLLMVWCRKKGGRGWVEREFEWNLLDRCHQAPNVSNRHHPYVQYQR